MEKQPANTLNISLNFISRIKFDNEIKTILKMPTNSLRMPNPQNTEANSRHFSPQKPLARP